MFTYMHVTYHRLHECTIVEGSVHQRPNVPKHLRVLLCVTISFVIVPIVTYFVYASRLLRSFLSSLTLYTLRAYSVRSYRHLLCICS